MYAPALSELIALRDNIYLYNSQLGTLARATEYITYSPIIYKVYIQTAEGTLLYRI
jgi:hypothetical protein